MSSRSIYFIFLITAFPGFVPLSTAVAQVSTKDSLSISMFFPSYSISLPSADMKNRFGLSHTIGGGYTFMTKKRWLFNVEGNFLFGKNIKNPGSVLAGDSARITTSNGYVINEEGSYANLALSERGFSFWLKAGKLIPLGKTNPNSGFVFMAGAGMLQHKIRIDVSQNTASQLRGDYKKGYDRLCNGPGITEFIGYQHLDEGKRLNFFAGLEFVQAWTKSRRAYYFAEQKKPDENRFDMLAGIKVGWIIPLYQKTGREFYYY